MSKNAKQPAAPEEPEIDLDYEFACFLIEQKARVVREVLVALIAKGELTVPVLVQAPVDGKKVHHELADRVVEMVNITFKGIQEA